MRISSVRRPTDAVPAAECLSDTELLQQFTTCNDHEAFAALVRRHGPMVFGVCRRVLRDSHDAEEAFQSTFLVLVRKAAGLSQPERIGSWLHGVAVRTAAKLKVTAARRAAHEAAVPAQPPPPDTDWADMRMALDEELVALPEKYRVPLVLCYLQGLTNEEAARKLGWPAGSMSYRLARGRELLKNRLQRRGVCFWSLPLAIGVCTRATASDVPEPLVQVTVRRATDATATQAAPASRRATRTTVVCLLLLFLGLGTVAFAAIPSRAAVAATPPGEEEPGPAPCCKAR